MSLITRKKGAFHDLEFQVDLRDYGKSDADIIEVTFLIKSKITDADDSLFEKKFTLNEITKTPDTAGTVINMSVEWLDTEYGSFVVGTEYQAGLFIQFNGDPNHDENVDQTFTVVIEEDFIDA